MIIMEFERIAVKIPLDLSRKLLEERATKRRFYSETVRKALKQFFANPPPSIPRYKKKSEVLKPMCFTLPKDLVAQIDNYIARTNVRLTRSEIVRFALEQYFQSAK
ncbi:putative regulatory protein [Sulfolobales Mexican fusellovirus 1]|uniref:putative regulatory protein n=1 Tax=Sulfolobales Mexican fusellovirus 1 TaxID=1298531 RepID=UPI0002C110CD|nr:putative regulatory protein [Sulfolobales Mexican fusellovirus 1]AGG36550.1 putative regulatory protein [Sulfolobales Mexican fusellovirus 1]